jgi:hypothetical protein
MRGGLNSMKKEIIYLWIFGGIAVLSRGLTLLTPTLAGDETSIGVMALRVMQGDFPVFFYGQNFMGTLEAFLMAFFFHLFSPSPLSLEILPALFSLLFLYLLYLSAKAFFDNKTGLMSVALLSIPPFFLLGWSHEARLHYHFVIIFGNFLLLLAQKMVKGETSAEGKRLLFLAMGLLAGIAWWTNYLIATYILSIGLLLFLKDKKILFRINFYFLLVMFLIGSLPLWAFNAIHRFPMIGIGGLASGPEIITHLRDFFLNAFPILLGFVPPLEKDSIDQVVYLIIGPLYGAAVVYFVYKFRTAFKTILTFRRSATRGGEVFFFLFIVTLLINLLTNYGVRLSDNDQKYLLPLYSCLPLFLSILFIDLKGQFSRFAFFLVALTLFSNLAGNIRHDGWIILNSKKLWQYEQSDRTEDQLAAFLVNRGYKRFYHDGKLGNRLMFRSKGGLVASHPYQEGCLKNSDLVDAAFNPSYLSLGDDQVFEERIKGTGGSFRKVSAPGGYLLYTAFEPPKTYRMIPQILWRGKSNIDPTGVKNAFDGDMATGWSTRGPQKKGTTFLLDLGGIERVGKISQVPAIYYQVPGRYQVALSIDGMHWDIVAQVKGDKGPTFWSGPNPMIKVRTGRIETVFTPQPCRFLKIVLLEDSPDTPWSINELILFGPEDERDSGKTIIPSVFDTDNLLNFLESQKIKFVYADHWLSAVIRVKSDWRIKTICSNYFTGDNGENEPPVEELQKAYLDNGVALVTIEPDREMEKIIQESGRGFKKKEIGPLTVYYNFSKPLSPYPLSVKTWKVSSNANSLETRKAIDGNPKTRWSTGRPQTRGDYFQIDLNEIRLIQGCELFLGRSLNDYPRKLKLFYSLDGSVWEEIKTTAQSGVYWTGEKLIKMTGPRYFFSPVKMRFLRLVQEDNDPVFYWSIHELALF